MTKLMWLAFWQKETVASSPFLPILSAMVYDRQQRHRKACCVNPLLCFQQALNVDSSTELGASNVSTTC